MSYRFAPIRNISMHYDMQGSGDPVVLIHAGIANLDMWDEQVAAFRGAFTVIRYDVRGFGETPDPPGAYTDHDDLASLLDYLGVSRAHVVGVSNGGRIASDFVLSYPERMSRLVLVAPALGGFDAGDDQFEVEMYRRYDLALEAGRKDEAAEIEAQIWVDGPERAASDVEAQFRMRALALIRHTIELGTGEGEGDIVRPPAAGRLAEIGSPTLLVMGELDLALMQKIGAAYEQGIPDIVRVDIPGTAHMVPMEKPAEFNQLVLEFLSAGA